MTLNISVAKLTENVELVGDIKSEEIWDGVQLDKMHIKAKRVGSTSADPSIYDWDTIAISAENNPAIRIVTWGMDTQLNGKDFKAGTTLQIAQNYVAPHEHEFVDGKCECGEVDSEYKAPTDPEDPKQPTNGGGCSIGVTFIIPFISALSLIILKRRNN